MIHKNELDVSNRSYTNKDFASIYPELLDLTKKISNRWDPEQSNESDPGIVLLKEAAFIADKENYNIDKNVLEAFMPSCTQRSSMQALCSMQGYNMKYYNSATTDISIVYTGNGLKADGSVSFTLPKYTTMCTDDASTIQYTLLEDCVISKANIQHTVAAIEGSVVSISIGDDNLVQPENIDDNYRLYLPVKQVAENGIFINNVKDTSLWKKVDNLNNKELGSKVFKLEYDSVNNEVYIQFPSDIKALIKDGIHVRYTKSSGVLGNISAGLLTSLVGVSQVTLSDGSNLSITDGISLSNYSAATDGADPETNEEAYNNFKRTVGTFDTLVTCRDYENYLYNMYNSTKRLPYVSNIKVGDRRNDPNYTNTFVTYTDYGNTKKSIPLYNDAGQREVTPYDVMLYPLKSVSVVDAATYNQSFKPMTETNIEKMWSDFSTNEDIDCISHDLKDLKDSDLYCVKNYYKLDCQIYTYVKSNSAEQAEIIQNVKNALYKAFNARKVDFGHALVTDTIEEVITNADARIKSIRLAEPELATKFMTKDGEEVELNADSASERSKSDIYLNLCMQNVLQGRISLFDMEEDFEFSFGQTKVSKSIYDGSPIIRDIRTVTTNTNIATAEVKNGYTLRENECIQVVQPSLITELTYPAYVNYNFQPDMTKGTPCEMSATPVALATKAEYMSYVKNTALPKIYYDAEIIPGATGGYLVDADGHRWVRATEDNFHYIEDPGTGDEIMDSYYTCIDMGTDGSRMYLEADVATKLSGAETLSIYYIDQSDATHVIEFTDKTVKINGSITELADNEFNIFRPNFKMERTQENAPSGTSSVEFSGKTYYVLDAEEQIEKLNFASVEISNSTLNCYWIVNSDLNQLFEDGSKERILTSGEYFFYTDSNFTTLKVLGAGTKLSLQKVPGTTWIINKEDMLTIDEISENGIDAFELSDWFAAKLVSNHLTITQMDVTTIGEGNTIYSRKQDGTSAAIATTGTGGNLTNAFTDLVNASDEKLNIYYTDLYGTSGTIVHNSIDGTIAQICSRLDIVAGPSSPQEILDGQTITFKSETETYKLTRDAGLTTKFELNVPISRAGGVDIDLTSKYISGRLIEDSTILNAYYYVDNKVQYAATAPTKQNVEVTRNSYNDIIVELKEATTRTMAVKLPVIMFEGYTETVLMYLDVTDEDATALDLKVWLYSGNTTGSGAENTLRRYNSGAAFANNVQLVPGLNIIEIDSTVEDDELLLYCNTNDTSLDAQVIIRNIKLFSGSNQYLNINSADMQYILENIRKRTVLDTKDLFDYTADVINTSAIEEINLDSPEAFFDSNNIACKWTIPQINFTTSTFTVAKSSRT